MSAVIGASDSGRRDVEGLQRVARAPAGVDVVYLKVHWAWLAAPCDPPPCSRPAILLFAPACMASGRFGDRQHVFSSDFFTARPPTGVLRLADAQVPDGWVPGKTLAVTVEGGQRLAVAVPPTAQVGSLLKVSLPSGSQVSAAAALLCARPEQTRAMVPTPVLPAAPAQHPVPRAPLLIHREC